MVVGYVSLGTNDLDRAKTFYADLLGMMGGKQVLDIGRGVIYSDGKGAGLMITKPYDKQDAHCGNGPMVAVQVASRKLVDEMYHKAIALGGKDEGPAALRGPDGPHAFYGGYFRDLDGNKLVIYHQGPADAAKNKFANRLAKARGPPIPKLRMTTILPGKSRGALRRLRGYRWRDIPEIGRAGITAGSLVAIGDVLAQVAASSGATSTSDLDTESDTAHLTPLMFVKDLPSSTWKVPDVFDWQRTGRLAFAATFFSGPYWHFAYRFIDSRFSAPTSRLSLAKVRAAFTKAAVTLFVGMPHNPLFFALLGILERKSYEEVANRTKLGRKVWQEGLVIWPFVNVANFLFIPPGIPRIAFGNTVGIAWNVYVSKALAHDQARAARMARVTGVGAVGSGLVSVVGQTAGTERASQRTDDLGPSFAVANPPSTPPPPNSSSQPYRFFTFPSLFTPDQPLPPSRPPTSRPSTIPAIPPTPAAYIKPGRDSSPIRTLSPKRAAREHSPDRQRHLNPPRTQVLVPPVEPKRPASILVPAGSLPAMAGSAVSFTDSGRSALPLAATNARGEISNVDDSGVTRRRRSVSNGESDVDAGPGPGHETEAHDDGRKSRRGSISSSTSSTPSIPGAFPANFDSTSATTAALSEKPGRRGSMRAIADTAGDWVEGMGGMPGWVVGS